jgi:methionyl-tRNA synthetase
MLKEEIKFDEYLDITSRLDIQYGQIVSSERVPKSKKLLKLLVLFGPDESDEKVVVTNLGDKFEPEAFVGLLLPFVRNLVPSEIMGIKSEAMIMVPQFNGFVELKNFSLGSKLL